MAVSSRAARAAVVWAAAAAVALPASTAAAQIPTPASAAAPASCAAGRPLGGHAATHRAPAVAIRVDQVGYPRFAPKLAEIMTTSRHPGRLRWLLIRRPGCTVAATGSARAGLGAWSRRYPTARLASFSRVTTTGTYRLELAGHPGAATPWFAIGPAARLYARPLANALAFYATERDGPDFIRNALRTAPGHLNDAHAMTYRTPPMNGDGIFRGSLRPYATGTVINATG